MDQIRVEIEWKVDMKRSAALSAARNVQEDIVRIVETLFDMPSDSVITREYTTHTIRYWIAGP